MGFSMEYGVHISKQSANKIYKLNKVLLTHSFEMVLFLPFFLSPHTVTVSYLSLICRPPTSKTMPVTEWSPSSDNTLSTVSES